ncbi:response regulator FixJ [Desertibaculum subflavum]|uniref:response regulator FixJ n=1 Tax=Desertibaculum subflavum TaxID=2268458 RepID=UPI000E669B2E
MPPDAVVYIVDDDDAVRDSLHALLESRAFRVESFASGDAFLALVRLAPVGCVVSDIRMPGLDGLQLQSALKARELQLPLMFITGHADVPVAVTAMKAGAVDFIEKPFEEETLLAAIDRAIRLSREAQSRDAETAEMRQRVDDLTAREREVLVCLAQGKQNKVIALELGISPRTVEIHRARVLEKMAARSLSDLVRAALAVGLA